ncbi:MAG: hypothetical protein QM758_02880 [Armatimonas sp.]
MSCILEIEVSGYRATCGEEQGIGETPGEALANLLSRLSGEPESPIAIWPYNHGDKFFCVEQQARLQELKAKVPLTSGEYEELERLVATAFEASVRRTLVL